MLNVLSYLLNLIDTQVIWLYAACLVVILLYIRSYVIARRDQQNSVFTIEKEVAAHRQGRAMSGIGALLGIIVVITALKYYVVPSVDLSAIAEPTPTLTLSVPTRVATETPTSMPTPPQATPTNTVRPLRSPRPTETPEPTTSATAALASPYCPDPNMRITMPRMNAVISGRVAIHGTAKHEAFQFYKLEYGRGEKPASWHGINDIHKTPVTNGVLEEFDTTALPNGVYWLQLTVVDQSGNFPAPCQVRVVVQN